MRNSFFPGSLLKLQPKIAVIFQEEASKLFESKCAVMKNKKAFKTLLKEQKYKKGDNLSMDFVDSMLH